ncbi:MAG: serine/threonine protein kinase [Desulfurococcales archaeon]|nr:serine/threonine protein kinase [Desulfurococcales archaeon]
MAGRLQELIEKLSRDDIKVLRTIEKLMSRHEYVPLELIERRSKIPGGRLWRVLWRLSDLKLVRRQTGPVTGYTLTYLGLDVIALSSLIGRGVISRVGERIGVGKEGDVYLVELVGGEVAAAKLHREGRTSFSKIRRLRGPAAMVDRKQWFRIAKLLGEREFRILVRLHERGAWVPEPIAWDRHCVVQEYREGVELYRVRELSLDEAYSLLEGVLRTLRIAYVDVGIVHGDLSEYNVLYEGEGKGVVIDWPQYVYKEEENAGELLERDVAYIVGFMRRRYGLYVDPKEALDYVKGAIPVPPRPQ